MLEKKRIRKRNNRKKVTSIESIKVISFIQLPYYIFIYDMNI